jgi:TrmH family RNA methyltransferase
VTAGDGALSLYEVDLRQPNAWIFGNEGAGVAPALAIPASRRVAIPMGAGTESLNVAAAAAICLFEAVRQRRAAQGDR